MTVRGVSVAAGANSGNVLTGKLFEFLERPSVVSVYPVGSAVGLQLTFNVGGEVFVQGEEISGANRFPTRNEDKLADGFGGAGERIVISFFNPTAGALTVFLVVDVNAIA